MIKFENTRVVGLEDAIRGMRNPKNSWERSDSFCDPVKDDCAVCPDYGKCAYIFEKDGEPYRSKIGPNDYDLMMRLRNAGTDHRKFMRMIIVYVDITAPLYWWKEFDTYKVGTVANSCSTMHKITDKEFTFEDFSYEHLLTTSPYRGYDIPKIDLSSAKDETVLFSPYGMLHNNIRMLNICRQKYLETKIKPMKSDAARAKLLKKYWWQMIQLLPSSYNQKRTVMLNYEVLANIYKSRRNHKLDEWAGYDCFDFLYRDCVTCVKYGTKECHSGKDNGFIQWIESLPYSEIITGSKNEIPDRKKDYETLKEIGDSVAKGFEEGFQNFYRKDCLSACRLCGAKKRGEVTEEDCAKCPRRPRDKQEE